MDLIAQLRAAIIAQGLPLPSQDFLHTLVTSRSPPLPLPSLIATAKARLLACDLTSSPILDPALTSLPQGVDNHQGAREARLPRPVHVQVLDVEDLSASRWEQVLELEAVERGERTRGREVVRVTADEDDDGQDARDAQTQIRRRGNEPASQSNPSSSSTSSRAATHRLVLQDCKGRKIFALELRRMSDRIGIGTTAIGEKIMLKAGTVVARGVVLLVPESCVFLGGRVEAWQKAWVEGRLGRLKEAAGARDRP